MCWNGRALPHADVIECCSVIALDFSRTSQPRQVGLSFSAPDVMKKSAVKDDPESGDAGTCDLSELGSEF